jgi:hypothetical protein
MRISEFTIRQIIHREGAEDTECCFYFSFAAETPREGGMTGHRQMKTFMLSAI